MQGVGKAATDPSYLDNSSAQSRHEALATREDIVRCYREILNRAPENEAAIEHHLSLGRSLIELMSGFINCDEHRNLVNRTRNSISLNRTFGRSYLANSLPVERRNRSFFFNHLFLSERIKPECYENLIYNDFCIYDGSDKLNSSAVMLFFAREILHEGELTLAYRHNGIVLYELSFTIVPNPTVASDERPVVLISRMQGVFGRRAEIVEATKGFASISPQFVLLYSLIGICKSLGITLIVCTSASEQLSYTEELAAVFVRRYDEFFLSLGATWERGFYLLRVPVIHKPLSELNPSHRSRAKRKRRLKDSISQAAEEWWRATMTA